MRAPVDDELVTAAEFGDHTQAVVARMHLEEAGIPAFLSDEWMSQGLFVLGSASGGIRLQVPASRLTEAVRLINDRMPENSAGVNWSEVDVGKPEAEEAVDEEEVAPEPSVQAVSPPAESEVEIEPVDLTLRERRANRIIRGALIGLVAWPIGFFGWPIGILVSWPLGVFAWPLFFFAVWRLIQIASSRERLRPEYQRKANIGAMILSVPIFLSLVSCCVFPVYRLAR
jgi:hypothetical protein